MLGSVDVLVLVVAGRRAEASREGRRRENATRGRGESEIEVRLDKVAPWK